MHSYRRAWAEGRIRRHANFASRYLSTRRDLLVYVPPGYDHATSRYPVLYLQDGQNLFDPATSYSGRDWNVDITADRMIEAAEIPPVIVVGIYNTGVRRLSEYTPTRDPGLRKGGKAERYAQMLACDIKPLIDSEYRTSKAADHTGVGGSSLGGLVSLTAALEYPRVFGKAAVMSPSVWWDCRAMLTYVLDYPGRTRPRIWLDAGTAEGSNPHMVVEDTRMLRDTLLTKGWEDTKNLRYREYPGATHSEDAWAARFGCVLAYLYGDARATNLNAC